MLILILFAAACVWFIFFLWHATDDAHDRLRCRYCQWSDRTDREARRRRAARVSARAARNPTRHARRRSRAARREARKYPPLVKSPYPGVGLVREGSIPDPLLYAHHLRRRGWPEDEIAAACARARADRRRASWRWPFLPPPSDGV